MKKQEEDFGGCSWHTIYTSNCQYCRERGKEAYQRCRDSKEKTQQEGRSEDIG